jgi:hypothetical protein
MITGGIRVKEQISGSLKCEAMSGIVGSTKRLSRTLSGEGIIITSEVVCHSAPQRSGITQCSVSLFEGETRT